jgi:hypothetical protein
MVIPNGDYVSETVLNWRENTDCIKDVFHEMMQDERADTTKPCIEWYYNNDEMLCLVKAK